jgi:hypothetical protein
MVSAGEPQHVSGAVVTPMLAQHIGVNRWSASGFATMPALKIPEVKSQIRTAGLRSARRSSAASYQQV